MAEAMGVPGRGDPAVSAAPTGSRPLPNNHLASRRVERPLRRSGPPSAPRDPPGARARVARRRRRSQPGRRRAAGGGRAGGGRLRRRRRRRGGRAPTRGRRRPHRLGGSRSAGRGGGDRARRAPEHRLGRGAPDDAQDRDAPHARRGGHRPAALRSRAQPGRGPCRDRGRRSPRGAEAGRLGRSAGRLPHRHAGRPRVAPPRRAGGVAGQGDHPRGVPRRDRDERDRRRPRRRAEPRDALRPSEAAGDRLRRRLDPRVPRVDPLGPARARRANRRARRGRSRSPRRDRLPPAHRVARRERRGGRGRRAHPRRPDGGPRPPRGGRRPGGGGAPLRARRARSGRGRSAALLAAARDSLPYGLARAAANRHRDEDRPPRPGARRAGRRPGRDVPHRGRDDPPRSARRRPSWLRDRNGGHVVRGASAGPSTPRRCSTWRSRERPAHSPRRSGLRHDGRHVGKLEGPDHERPARRVVRRASPAPATGRARGGAGVRRRDDRDQGARRALRRDRRRPLP